MSDPGTQAIITEPVVRRPAARRTTARAIVSWWSRRPALAAAAIYALLSIVLVGQGLLPGRTLAASDYLWSSVPWLTVKPASIPDLGTNFELIDQSTQFLPFLHYTRAHLPDIPLWNPHIGVGRPYVANGQSAVFSPFSLPIYVLPFWKSLAVVAMLKLFLAALGTYALGRALGMRFGGALVSGLIFAFSTSFVVWIAWELSGIYALAPWILLLTELVVRRPAPLRVAGLAALIALQFLCGFPEASFHLLFVTTVFFTFRVLLRRHREGAPARALGPPTLAFGIAVVGGSGLAAIVLAPFLEFVLHSGELARRSNATPGHWPQKYLGALFLHDYWGRPTQLNLEPFMNIRSWYAGALTLMLAGTALLLRRTAERIGVAVFAVFVVSMVVGLPPVFDLVTKLPLFKAAHNERLLIYFALCLALLAGWGLDDLASRRLPSLRSRRAVIGAGAVLLCVPIVWMARAGTLTTDGLASALKVAWGFQHPPAVPPKVDVLAAPSAYIVRSSALLMWLPLAALGLALIVWRLRPGRRLPVAAFVGLAAALLVVDLFRANMGFNPAIRTSTAVQPATGAIRYLQSRRPNRFVGLGANVRQRMPPNVAMNYGLYDARGYDYPVEKHLDAFWRRIVAPTASDFTQPEEFSDATPTAIRALTLVSVSDLIGSTGDPPLHVPGLRVAYRGPDAIVYANDRALPRVLLVDQQRTVSRDRTALAAVTAPGFDARRIAVTERALPGLPQATPGAPRAGGTARMVSYGGERVIIDATAPRPSLLVLTDTFYPGWKATVDGRPAPIERVDYMLRGVALKPGRHTVEFSYRPASWRIGWIISLVSLVALIAAALWGWRVWYRGRSR